MILYYIYDIMCCTLTLSRLRQGRLVQANVIESERKTTPPTCSLHDAVAEPVPQLEQCACLTHLSASSLAQGNNKSISLIKNVVRASLVAQWLRICLLMQGTRVRALVWEDPTCHGAAGPVSHNC